MYEEELIECLSVRIFHNRMDSILGRDDVDIQVDTNTIGNDRTYSKQERIINKNHNNLSNEPTSTGISSLQHPLRLQFQVRKVGHYQMKVTFINNKETADVDISKCATVVL